VTAFTDEISENPMLFTLLQVVNVERRQFCAAQSATQEHGNHRVIPNSSQCPAIKHFEQAPCLGGDEPVSDANAEFLSALHSTNSGSQVGAEQCLRWDLIE